jgi:phenylpropionate dioxygenase-like ring-hydroxylating dioxygenase large terminal subunit
MTPYPPMQGAPIQHGWTLAGSASALDRPGSFVTCESGLTPMLVVRGQDGALRAFVNMCRHRGMALLQGCGETGKSITCPYHAWRFDTTGALRVIPQRATQFPGVDRADWSLIPGAVAELAGLIFASAEPSAPALPDLLPVAWTESDEAAARAEGAAGTFELEFPGPGERVSSRLTVDVRQQQLVAVATTGSPAGYHVSVGVGCADEADLASTLVRVRAGLTVDVSVPQHEELSV